MKKSRFIIRLFISLILLILVDTQIRYLVEMTGIVNLKQDTFVNRWDNHLMNTFSQFMTQFFLLAWAYFIIIMAFGWLNKYFTKNQGLITTLSLSIVICEIPFIAYWWISSRGVMENLYHGLIIYFILGLTMPLLLRWIMTDKTTYFGKIIDW